MSELQAEYAGRVVLEVHPLSDAPELNARLFPSGKHGIILYDAKGEIVGTIEGHGYGREEIVALLKNVE